MSVCPSKSSTLSIVPSALNFPVLEHVSVVGVLAAAMAPLFQVEFRGSTILPWIFTVDNWMRGQQVWVLGEEVDSDTGDVNKKELVLLFNVL